MNNTELHAAAITLLRECFEGREPARNYTWFVEGKEGMFDAFESVDAAQASKRANDTAASIAAHANHVLYTLRGANVMAGGPEPEGDWECSWSRQSVTDEEWLALGAAIRVEYSSFMKWIRNQSEWADGNQATAALAVLPHMAFHLGAVRQLMRL